jgi:hypothetical protein
MRNIELCKPFGKGLFIWKISHNKKSLIGRSDAHIQMRVEPIP